MLIATQIAYYKMNEGSGSNVANDLDSSSPASFGIKKKYIYKES